MHEILGRLSADSTVLDLGCGPGSFSWQVGRLVRMDRQLPISRLPGLFLIADAAALPLADSALDAVISNHSLEHFCQLDEALNEIGRTLKPGGALFVAVPDASTFSDALYRWLSRGGGHVNAFRNAASLISRVEARTGLSHRATRPLFSSLSFLNRANWPSRPPRKLLLLGQCAEWSLRLYTLASRWADRLLGTRFSAYGWAIYFGGRAQKIDCKGWCNVCIRCGSAAPSQQLRAEQRVFQRWRSLDAYHCPICSTCNYFFDDRHFSHFH
ncbi:MAG: methyltransferase domain-containing protein [Acidobacteriota bacterium]